MTYYKFLTDRNTGGHQDYQWPLPCDGEPGAWTPEVKGPLVICDNGYHVLDGEHLYAHIQVNLYEVEIDINDHIEGNGKHVVRRAQLIRKLDGWTIETMRLFALDCAIKVLPIFEWAYPDDACVRDCIIATRKFLYGEGSKEELEEAVTALRALRALRAEWAASAVEWAASAVEWAAASATASATPSAADASEAASAAASATDASEAEWVAWVAMCQWQSARVLKYAHGAASPLALPERVEA